MAKAWYILHVYSGYENKIEKTIRMLIDSGELSRDIVTDVKVPAEEVAEIKRREKAHGFPQDSAWLYSGGDGSS